MFAPTARTPSSAEGTTSVTASPVAMIVCEWWIAISRRSPRAIAAGFHHTASLPGSSPTTACPSPTARAPIGRRRNNAPSVAGFCATARAGASAAIIAIAARTTASTPLLERRRLIDEHDRDGVAHGIGETARRTDQRRFTLAVLEWSLALRADQDRQQLWSETQ